MAKSTAKDPRSNLFELLADDSSAGDAPKVTKKVDKKVDKKDDKIAPKPVVGATPTPAALAAQRKLKEDQKAADKAAADLKAKEDALKFPQNEQQQPQQQPAEQTTIKKLSKEQWLEQEFKQVVSKKNKNQGQDQNQEGQDYSQGSNRNNRPRQQGDAPRGGGGGRGQGRGGRRGGGRRPGGDVNTKPQRLEENRNRDVNQRGTDLSEGHEAPRGREFDRKSGGVTTRKAPPRKQGVGLGSFEPTEASGSTDQTTGWDDIVPAPVTEEWGDLDAPAPPEEKSTTETGGEKSTTEGGTNAVINDKRISFAQHLKQKEEKAKELAEKLAALRGSTDTPAPRVVEYDDNLKPRENVRASADTTVKAIEKPEAPKKDKKEKSKTQPKGIAFEELNFKVGTRIQKRPPGGRQGERRPPREGEENTENQTTEETTDTNPPAARAPNQSGGRRPHQNQGQYQNQDRPFRGGRGRGGSQFNSGPRPQNQGGRRTGTPSGAYNNRGRGNQQQNLQEENFPTFEEAKSSSMI